MLMIIQSLFYLCLMTKYISAETDIYKFAASLDSKDLKIYNGQELQKTILLNDLSYSLDFDPDTNIIIGSRLKIIFAANINDNSIISWSQEEDGKGTRAIAFLNKTHFIAGFEGFIVIYDCSNLDSKLKKPDNTNIGKVYDIKILHEEQKILIASHEGYISVFDLKNNYFLKKNQIADKIWAIDAFDKNLIVSQCNKDQDVCLYKLNSSNNLIELKKCSGINEIFTIKILNKNKVVFGGDKFLKVWDISSNQIIQTITDVDKVWGLDVFSEEIIASGDEENFVKFWNMVNYSNFKTFNIESKVHYLINMNGYSALKNYLNLKINPHSTQLSNLESTQSTLKNMQTTVESTKHELTIFKLSSIDTLIPTETRKEPQTSVIDTLAETTTKLIQSFPESNKPSQYSSFSSNFFKILTTLKTENSPTQSSNTKYLSHTQKITNSITSNIYSEEQSTATDKEKTTIEGSFFEWSETASSFSEQQLDSTHKGLELTSSDKERTTRYQSKFHFSSTSQELIKSTFSSRAIQSSPAEQNIHSTQLVHDVDSKTSLQDSSFDLSTEMNMFLTSNIQHDSKEDFSFLNLQPSELIDVLKKNLNLNDCLKNCSGNGLCKLIDKSLFVCECFNNFAGSSCQINTLPCASYPCLNNATCINNLAIKTYNCKCKSDSNGKDLYIGKNCQNKVDICVNETCSKNGVCYDVNDKAKCQCFSSYSGEKCQIESDESKTRKAIIKTSTIVAIIVLFLLFLILIVNDLSSFFCEKKTEKKKYVVQKLVYIN